MQKQKKFFIRPAKGRRVKDPVTMKLISESGEVKPQTTFWLRRLRDGDVEIAKKFVKETSKPDLKSKDK